MSDDGGRVSVMPSIPEREAECARLSEYFRALDDGVVVTWERIESDTGVTMDCQGKDQVRRALRRIKRPYAAVRGVGVELSSPDNALTIMRSRFVRIDRSVSQADRTRTELSTRHLDAMNDGDRNRMLMLAAFFGAVRTIARDSRPKIIGDRAARK